MINLYSGKPGSGKSLHASSVIYNYLRHGKRVISSYPVNLEVVADGCKKPLGEFIFLPYTDMTPRWFVDFYYDNHVPRQEHQTLVVIDEAHLLFDAREFKRSDRKGWLSFFALHRHLGYDFLIISQYATDLDSRIRQNFDCETVHRKLNTLSNILSFIKVPIFVFATFYCGAKQSKLRSEFFFYRKKYSELYDSFSMAQYLEALFPARS